jgi:hypothetical protein
MRYDPPDDDAYDLKYDGTACEDCGRPSVAWLCESCSDARESWAAATAIRMSQTSQTRPAVIEVALVPTASSKNLLGPVVEVALVPRSQIDQLTAAIADLERDLATLVAIKQARHPIAEADARFLKRMAKAILTTDFSKVRDVA